MTSSTTPTTPPAPGAGRRWLAVLIAGLAFVALLALADWINLLLPTDSTAGDSFGALTSAIERVKTPATAILGSLSGMGLLAGGAMTALGLPQGMRMMTMSALAIGAVLLGNGLIA